MNQPERAEGGFEGCPGEFGEQIYGIPLFGRPVMVEPGRAFMVDALFDETAAVSPEGSDRAGCGRALGGLRAASAQTWLSRSRRAG